MLWCWIASALAAGPEVAPSQAVIEVSAGYEESSYFRWATGMAGAVDGVRVLVQPSGGSGDNLAQVASGRVDLGLVQGDVAWHGRHATGRTVSAPDLVALGVIYTELVHLVVRADGEVASLQDLSGRRVDVGAPGSGTLYNGLDALAAAGVTDAELEFVGSYGLQRLAQRQIDGLFNTSAAPWQAVLDDPTVLVVPFAPDALAMAPYYEVAPLPEAYGQGDGVYVAALVVAMPDLADDVVTAVMDGAGLSSEGVTVPLHPAAEAWYAARGESTVVRTAEGFVAPPLPALPPSHLQDDSDTTPERVLGVNAVVRTALRENPAVRVAALAQRSADLGVLSKQSAWLPWFSAGVAAGGDGEGAAWEDGVAVSVLTPLGTELEASIDGVSSALGTDATWSTTTAIGLTQPLLDGGGLDANVADLRRAKIDAAVAELATEKAAIDLAAAVVKRYWDLAEAYARVSLRRDQVDRARRHANRVEAQVQIGEADQLAVQEARYALMAAERDLLGEQRAVRDAGDALLDDMQARFSFRLVPLGDVVDAALAALSDDDSLQRRVVTAQLRRPDLQQTALAVQRARVDLAQARNGALPDLAASASVGSVASDDATLFGGAVGTFTDGAGFWSGGLTVGMPLGRGADPLAFASSRLAAQQKEILLDDALEVTERDVRVAWRALNTARSQLDVALAAADIADQRHALAIEAFRTGEADSFKVLTYQQDYLDARLSVAAAATDYLQAVAELDRVTGTALDPYRDLFDAMVSAP